MPKKTDRTYGSGDTQVAVKNEMTKFYWVLAFVAVLGVGIVGWSIGSKARPTISAPIEIPGLDDPAKLMEVARGVVRGNADAPYTIIEFADFQCPGCGAFAREDEPVMRAELIETGKAKFVFYDYPLVTIHNHAFLASRAAHCAEDQDKFWEYHDILYVNQARWAAEQNPASLYEEYAGQVGIDTKTFTDCLESDRHADVVTANMKLGDQLQVPYTPTILVTPGNGMGRQVTATIQGIREALALLEAEAARAAKP